MSSAAPTSTREVVVFSHPTHDDYEQADEKARELLREILPDYMWKELEEKGIIRYKGKHGTYVISSYKRTEIRDSVNG